MNKVQNLTVTSGRAKSSIETGVTNIISEKVTNQINQAIANERPTTGVVTKFYPWLDKAEVKLDKTNKKVLCKILHRHGGELLDFYTPFGDQTLCDKLKEPCVIPRDTLHCLVMHVTDLDSEEHLILGFYMNEEIVGLDPAKPGNMKLITRGGSNHHWLSFGYCGLDVRTSKEPTAETGLQTDERVPLEYVTSDDVYSKEELYTREDVDDIVNGLFSGFVGSFTINADGHLIVDLPPTVSNFYSINGSGHLVVSLPSGAANPYTIESDGHLFYNKD